MTRARVDYSDGSDFRATGFDPDLPVAGHYRFRMRSGGALCGVRIWHGAPHDPVTGEELDRSPRWQALVNDDPVEIERVWPRCAADPISDGEYRHYCRTQAWAQQHAPDSALADPRRKADPLTTPLLF